MNAASTVAQIDYHFPKHVYPYFGRRPVAAIKPSDVQGFVRHMQAKLAPSTIEVIYRYVVSVFRSAVLDGTIPKSPCVKIKRPTIERKRVEPLLLEVVEMIRETLPPHLAALSDLGALVGCRQGEAFGVEVEHVDFLHRTVRIEQQLLQVGGGAPFHAPPK